MIDWGKEKLLGFQVTFFFSHRKSFVKKSCEKKLKMGENSVENEIKLDEPTMRVVWCWE